MLPSCSFPVNELKGGRKLTNTGDRIALTNTIPITNSLRIPRAAMATKIGEAFIPSGIMFWKRRLKREREVTVW